MGKKLNLSSHPMYQEPPKKRKFKVEFSYTEYDSEIIEAMDEDEATEIFWNEISNGEDDEIQKIRDLGEIKIPDNPNQLKLPVLS